MRSEREMYQWEKCIIIKNIPLKTIWILLYLCLSNLHVQLKGQDVRSQDNSEVYKPDWGQKVSSEVKGQISVLTVMTSVSMGLISTTFAWYGSSRHMGALSFMSRTVMFTCSGQMHRYMLVFNIMHCFGWLCFNIWWKPTPIINI